jgi:hypothetical protein
MNWLNVKLTTAANTRTANKTAAPTAQLNKTVNSGTLGASCEPATPAKADSMTIAKSDFNAASLWDFD